MNQPEAKRTQEGTAGGFCADREVLAVFFHPCIEAVLRDENDGRAKETQALPSPNYQQGVPVGYGRAQEAQEVRCRTGRTGA